MSKDITKFKDIHKGKDVWVVLAGPSMNYIDPSFFDNKITVGVNQVYRFFKSDYIVMKDLLEAPRFVNSCIELEKYNIPLIYPKYYKGVPGKGLNSTTNKNSFVFNHNPRENSILQELDQLKENELIVTKSTATTAFHFAAYLGAKNIMVAGHDCGVLNGCNIYKKYLEEDWKSSAKWSGYEDWMSDIEAQSILVRDFLKVKYNCNIHSINPFIGLSLEKNTFVSS